MKEQRSSPLNVYKINVLWLEGNDWPVQGLTCKCPSYLGTRLPQPTWEARTKHQSGGQTPQTEGLVNNGNVFPTDLRQEGQDQGAGGLGVW